MRRQSNITLITTGGTIAGVELPKSTAYNPGVLEADALLRGIQDRIQDVRIVQKRIANVGSHELNWDDLWRLHSAVAAAISDPMQEGIVITVGTDLGASVAFFLDMTTQTDKPIVLVGAMRPASAVSADGPGNLLHAIYIAKSQWSCGRGVLWTSHGEIHSAFHVQKAHTDAPGAFASPGSGLLGFMKGNEPIWYYPASRPLGYFGVNPAGLSQRQMPLVATIYAHIGMVSGQARKAVELGARGVVLAGLGAGGWPPNTAEEVRSLQNDHGIIVILAKQTFSGHILEADVGIPGGFLDVHKCIIALQVFLGLGYDHSRIKAAFIGQGRDKENSLPRKLRLSQACCNAPVRCRL